VTVLLRCVLLLLRKLLASMLLAALLSLPRSLPSISGCKPHARCQKERCLCRSCAVCAHVKAEYSTLMGHESDLLGALCSRPLCCCCCCRRLPALLPPLSPKPLPDLLSTVAFAAERRASAKSAGVRSIDIVPRLAAPGAFMYMGLACMLAAMNAPLLPLLPPLMGGLLACRPATAS
jgi:hypothetical protein